MTEKVKSLNQKHIAVKFLKDTKVAWYEDENSKDPYDISVVKEEAFAGFEVLKDHGETIDVMSDYGVVRGLRKDNLIFFDNRWNQIDYEEMQ